jgi:hypothetical protein
VRLRLQEDDMDAEKMSKDFDHIVCPFVDDRNEVERN